MAGRTARHWLPATGAIALMAVTFWFLPFAQLRLDPTDSSGPVAQRVESASLRRPRGQLTDEQVQAAADDLLALVDPDEPENAYFPDFARDRLRWLVRENRSGQLDVALVTDDSAGLPDDVLMAASRLNGKPTILIAKPRFVKFLVEGGSTTAPFTAEQKNDFAVGLVHEIVHLQNPNANPRSRQTRLAEESRVWREVDLQVVRPLRARGQPMHSRFRDVDDALRLCHDELPCPLLTRLVRTNP